MNICPVTYEPCGEDFYSPRGLRQLNKRLTDLTALPLSAPEQRREALARAGKLSIQGIQPKLSARLDVKNETFEIVDRYGTYIIKPQHADFPLMPENEGLSMHLAAMAGLEVPVSGLVRSADGSFSYFIRRFDRTGNTGRVAVEDFAQLSGRDRSTKYDSSMERLVEIIDSYCTFPVVEKVKLFERTLFSFLVGNEDMHLKNTSLIRREGRVELSPLYDCLNTTIELEAIGRRPDEIEETALPLRGRKRNLSRHDLVDYFGRERLGLNGKVVEGSLLRLVGMIPEWTGVISISFLDEAMKARYRDLLLRRSAVLQS